jgi:hypothetical protein
MTDGIEGGSATDRSESGLTRRSVVRTSAHLAWAVPAVTMATAAPALAVSGPAHLRMSGFSVNYSSGHTQLDVHMGPVKNNGGSDAGQLTAVVEVPEKKKGPFRKAPAMDGGASDGWKFAGRSGNGPWTFTFVATDGHLRAGEKTRPLDFALALAGGKKGPKATIGVSVVGDGDSASDSDSLPAFE